MCMCVCVCVCMYMCVYLYICVCVSISLCLSLAHTHHTHIILSYRPVNSHVNAYDTDTPILLTEHRLPHIGFVEVFHGFAAIREGKLVGAHPGDSCVCVCVCVCDWEREREMEGGMGPWGLWREARHSSIQWQCRWAYWNNSIRYYQSVRYEVIMHQYDIWTCVMCSVCVLCVFCVCSVCALVCVCARWFSAVHTHCSSRTRQQTNTHTHTQAHPNGLIPIRTATKWRDYLYNQMSDTHTHTHTHTDTNTERGYVYVYVCVCVCACGVCAQRGDICMWQDIFMCEECVCVCVCVRKYVRVCDVLLCNVFYLVLQVSRDK